MEANAYTVVYGSENLKTAAEKLAGYLKNVTGTECPVTDALPQGKYILLHTAPLNTGDGYKITGEGKNVLITGSSLSWTVRGAFAFLEKYCGVKCLAPDIIRYTQKNVTVPDGKGLTYKPFFEFTDTDWKNARDTDYCLFNGINSGGWRSIPEELGGTVNYISSSAHTLSTRFCARDTYFEKHPEYFALRSGKRNSGQLCLSDPDVLKIVTDEVFALLKEKHDPAAGLQIVSLTQDDNLHYCRCEKCRETDRHYGSHAGTMLEFVNAVAREVKAAGYDNVAIDTFAYQYTRKVPSGIVPEDNVIVRLCSIECCFSHPFDDPDCPANAAFLADLEGWSKICRRLYIWDYCTDFTNYIGIFPDFGVLQRNVQIFCEHNVRGLYEEGNYSAPARDTEFGGLRCLMIAKLLQDPYCDLRKVREEFLEAYYGNAADAVGRFLDVITDNAAARHLGIYQPMRSVLSLGSTDAKECDILWRKAESEAEKEVKQRVLDSELCWRWWKYKNRMSEFSSPLRFGEEKRKLNAAIDATGVRRREFGGARAFFIELYQDLSAPVYPLLALILDKIVYKL